VTIQQAGKLSAVIDVSTEAIMDANPPLPSELVAELSRPLRRRQAQQLAPATDVAPDPRIRAAFGILALAARQSGGTHSEWRARTDTYFQAHRPEAAD
jgi:hypothetical protein